MRVAAVASALLLLLVTGCPPQGPPAPPNPAAPPPTPILAPESALKTVVFAGGYTDPVPPALCGTVEQARTVNQIYEGLAAYDENMRVVPALAESWKISDDLTTYTFVLRDKLTFSDGSALAAADVVRSFEVYAKDSKEWFWVVEPI